MFNLRESVGKRRGWGGKVVYNLAVHQGAVLFSNIHTTVPGGSWTNQKKLSMLPFSKLKVTSSVFHSLSSSI